MTDTGRTLLDLPDYQLAMLRAALNGVCFGMNRSAKRVVGASGAGPISHLSPKMRHAVIRIAYRYRRQLPHKCLPFFLTFTREQLVSRPQDHTWNCVSPTNGNVPIEAKPAGRRSGQPAQLGLTL